MTISLSLHFVIFPFFSFKDIWLDKFAIQIMTNETIISLSLSISLPFYNFFFLRDVYLNQFANLNKYKLSN